MADFIDIINTRGHMCQKYFLERSIHKCPLYKQTAAGCGDCAAWIVGHPHEAQSIITNWEECNKKPITMLDIYLKEMGEDADLENMGVPSICPAQYKEHWGGTRHRIIVSSGLRAPDGVCCNMKSCDECWNRIAPKE